MKKITKAVVTGAIVCTALGATMGVMASEDKVNNKKVVDNKIELVDEGKDSSTSENINNDVNKKSDSTVNKEPVSEKSDLTSVKKENLNEDKKEATEKKPVADDRKEKPEKKPITNNDNNNKPVEEKVNLKKYKDEYIKRLAGVDKKAKELREDVSDTSTLALSANQRKIFDLYDAELNSIYSLLKSKLPASSFEGLKNSQIAWLKERDKKGQAVIDSYQGGREGGMIALSTVADFTKERCQYLINEYMK